MSKGSIKDRKKHKQTIKTIKANLKRLEAVIKSKYVRPADYVTRDRLARKLRDVKNIRP